MAAPAQGVDPAVERADDGVARRPRSIHRYDSADSETVERMVSELAREFPAVAEAGLAAAVESALGEFAHARIRVHVPVLALRQARENLWTATGLRPLPRSRAGWSATSREVRD